MAQSLAELFAQPKVSIEQLASEAVSKSTEKSRRHTRQGEEADKDAGAVEAAVAVGDHAKAKSKGKNQRQAEGAGAAQDEVERERESASESESESESERESNREEGKGKKGTETERGAETKRRELQGAAKRIEDKKAEEERDSRTVFVGNLSLSTKQKQMRSFFEDCGEIEAVRFRSIPTLESKLPKRASVALKQYSDAKDSMNGYVVFKDKAAVVKALKLNGRVFHDRHIRVDVVAEQKNDYKKTVFVGNIPFRVSEEELWNKFLPFGHVQNVRIVRDRYTQKSKGIAYVMFSTKEERVVATAAEVQIDGRTLRIKKATSKTKLDKKEQIRATVQQTKLAARAQRKRPVISQDPSTDVAHVVPNARAEKKERRKEKQKKKKMGVAAKQSKKKKKKTE